MQHGITVNCLTNSNRSILISYTGLICSVKTIATSLIMPSEYPNRSSLKYKYPCISSPTRSRSLPNFSKTALTGIPKDIPYRLSPLLRNSIIFIAFVVKSPVILPKAFSFPISSSLASTPQPYAICKAYSGYPFQLNHTFEDILISIQSYNELLFLV